MNEDLIKGMQAFFGDMSDTEKRMLELVPKTQEYCNKEDESYKFTLDMLVSILKAEPGMIAYMAQIAGIMNLAYVSGIERGKKMAMMQAFVSAEEK